MSHLTSYTVHMNKLLSYQLAYNQLKSLVSTLNNNRSCEIIQQVNNSLNGNIVNCFTCDIIG